MGDEIKTMQDIQPGDMVLIQGAVYRCGEWVLERISVKRVARVSPKMFWFDGDGKLFGKKKTKRVYRPATAEDIQWWNELKAAEAARAAKVKAWQERPDVQLANQILSLDTEILIKAGADRLRDLLESIGK